MTVLFSDDFAGTGALSGSWLLPTGWARDSGQAVNNGGPGGSAFNYADTGDDDQLVTADFTWGVPVSGVEEVGVLARVKDGNNFVMWAYVYNTADSNDRAYKLYVRSGGNYFDKEFIAASAPSGGVELGVQVVGNEVRAYIDGDLATVYTLLDAERTNLAGGTYAGLYLTTATVTRASSILVETPVDTGAILPIEDNAALLTGLAGRWRADRLLSVVDAQGAWSWPDLSGNANHLFFDQFKPVYDASGPIGKASVHFGAGQRIEAHQNFTSDQGGGADLTLAMVVEFDEANAGYNSFVSSQGGGNVQFYRKDGSGGRYAVYAGGSEVISSVAINTSPHVLTYVLTSDRSNSKIYLDGTEIASGNPGGGTLARLRFAPGDATLAFDLYEAFLFKGALDADARTVLHSCMQEYYGITVSDYAPQAPSVTLAYVDGAGALAEMTFEGVWDGTTVQPVELEGLWNGTAVVPLG